MRPVTAKKGADEARVAAERRHFESAGAYDPLPEICRYRTRRYVQPRVNEVFGTRSQADFYTRPILEKAASGRQVTVLSLGSGNGELELGVASDLLRSGTDRFHIEGLELSAVNVEAANANARAQGLEKKVSFFEGDFNTLTADREQDFVIANQVLHHVSALEDLFDALGLILGKDGLLLTRDMIGRNGHLAWPECRELIDRVWSEIPRRYRYSHRENRFLDEPPDRDYSRNSFEGIRAQDILPLMLERFSFARFYAFGGITEKILNRALGPNFSVDNEDDLAFVNNLELLNDTAINGGLIKPTVMLAHVSVEPRTLTCWRERTPERCVHMPG